jgi:hypothetical protein
MIIAIVCDCDDTLAPDTTAQLLEACGINSEDFYRNEVGPLVRQGYDPAVAYLTKILEKKPDLTQTRIQEIGAGLSLYPGVPKIFRDLTAEVKEEFGKDGIMLQKYIISGGIKDLIAAKLGGAVDKIWGCNFAYGPGGQIAHIKNVVSFTEKTRFLFNIQKGLVLEEHDCQPYAVNVYKDPQDRAVPFDNMIYIGDGPSDIPCMSLITTFGKLTGRTVGILSDQNPSKTWTLSHGRRASITLPADFRKSQHAYRHIREAVMNIGKRIIAEKKSAPYPTY